MTAIIACMLAAALDAPTADHALDAYERSVTSRERIAFSSDVRVYWQDRPIPAFARETRILRDGEKLDGSISRVGANLDDEAAGTPFQMRHVVSNAGHHLYAPGDACRLGVLMHWDVQGRQAQQARRAENFLLWGADMLDGSAGRRTDKSLPQILRDADQLDWTPQPQSTDGHETFRVTATDEVGTYSLWLDPQLGWQPRRIEAEQQWTSRGIRNRYHTRIDRIEYETIEGQRIPVAARVENQVDTSAGFRAHYAFDYRREQINLNPDFAAMDDAFVMQIDPQNTHVRDMDRVQIPMRFENGRVVPAADAAALAWAETPTEDAAPTEQPASPRYGAFAWTEAPPTPAAAGWLDRGAPTWLATLLAAAIGLSALGLCLHRRADA